MVARIIVLDVAETCWDRPEKVRTNTSEIIEIACVEINAATAAVCQSKSYFCIPEMSKISYYSFELYGVTNTRIAQDGIRFADALGKLRREFQTLGAVLATWDMTDLERLERQCKRLNMTLPFFRSRLLVSDLVAITTGQSFGLEDAVKQFGLQFQGRRHDSMSDAQNTAAVLVEILKNMKGNDRGTGIPEAG